MTSALRMHERRTVEEAEQFGREAIMAGLQGLTGASG
jgi:hypothetical protein